MMLLLKITLLIQVRVRLRRLARRLLTFVHGSVVNLLLSCVNEVLFGGGDFKKLSDDDLGWLKKFLGVDAEIDVTEVLVELITHEA